ncbi:hypothetical protein EFM06_04340 [Lactobacillus helveticus]|uniref:hypothetical protein n=2 Tax=Lactobacillus helveticus TaxID=1587 RepID=UPI002181FD4F|nr:hypothetical protein [Lactobacillus helveticus]MCT0165042.1 hypothetical protein [Lactobacillus helveticus]MCT0193427.1 hypothetical protein [Lactobacillus helveticus]MCT0197031.1 hypothetical protein [Lactobacillus helveticus]
MPLCQLFINHEQNQFIVVQMPDEITPDKYQGWITHEEQVEHVQAFDFSQQLLDRVTLKYVAAQYEAKYVMMKAPVEEQLFVSSLEISKQNEEKLDVVRNGLLIVFDKEELEHFTSFLQEAWNEARMQYSIFFSSQEKEA